MILIGFQSKIIVFGGFRGLATTKVIYQWKCLYKNPPLSSDTPKSKGGFLCRPVGASKKGMGRGSWKVDFLVSGKPPFLAFLASRDLFWPLRGQKKSKISMAASRPHKNPPYRPMGQIEGGFLCQGGGSYTNISTDDTIVPELKLVIYIYIYI